MHSCSAAHATAPEASRRFVLAALLATLLRRGLRLASDWRGGERAGGLARGDQGQGHAPQPSCKHDC